LASHEVILIINLPTSHFVVLCIVYGGTCKSAVCIQKSAKTEYEDEQELQEFEEAIFANI